MLGIEIIHSVSNLQNRLATLPKGKIRLGTLVRSIIVPQIQVSTYASHHDSEEEISLAYSKYGVGHIVEISGLKQIIAK